MARVVLLDDSGHATGVLDKAAVHHDRTPLHLAFSCYVFNSRDELLLTQRAWEKRTWPGVWSNTCCGHPEPSEPLRTATLRRVSEELGMRIARLTLVLARFRYRAEMPDGMVENEMCPVFRAYTDSTPHPDPAEVAGTEWVAWSDFAAEVLDTTRSVAPWCAEQVGQLTKLGARPSAWPTAEDADLPPAARQPLSPHATSPA